MAEVYSSGDVYLENIDQKYYSKGSLPRIIHQTWFGIESPEIPDKWKKSSETWIRLHPECLYILWSKSMARNFIKRYQKNFLETYDSLKYEIQRIDCIRYVFLKWIGGIYSDLDIVPKYNIYNYLTEGELFLVRSRNSPDNYTNSFMCSIKDCPFWDRLLNYVKEKKDAFYIGKWMTVMFVSGPVAVTEVSKTYPRIISQLPTIFATQSIDDQEERSEDVFIVLKGGSWHNFDAKLVAYVFYNRKIIFLLLLVIVLLFIIGYISYKKKYNSCKISLNKCIMNSPK